jgi:hypothetical protein
MYPRHIAVRLEEALADTRVVALNGSRQSGKTTIAQRFITPQRPYITLDDATQLAAARTDPVGFIRNLEFAIIDEVQRAPDLLLAIKKTVDEHPRPGRFLVTGSANLLSIPTIKDSLAGRLETKTLYPLSRSEILRRPPPAFLSQAFRGRVPRSAERLLGRDLIDVVSAGGYPEVLARSTERRRRDWCEAYIDAIVQRDVRDIAAVEKLGQLARLFEVVAPYAGQLINASAIGTQLSLDHKTADRYITILEQLFLIRRLQPWSRNETGRLVKTAKLQFLDSGLLTAAGRRTTDQLVRDRAALGPIFESFVFGELLKQASWSDDRIALFHYRDKDRVEVDFVIENARREVVGVEVKAAATVTAADFAGLRKLKGSSGKSFRAGIIVYDGDNLLSFGDDLFAAPYPSLWS